MNNKVKAVKLTEKDKNTIVNHGNVCTDTHGSGCLIDNSNEHDKELN